MIDFITNQLNEGNYLKLIIGFFVILFTLFLLRYIIHKMRYASYQFSRQKKKNKIKKIMKKLGKHDNYNKLATRDKKRLTEYIKFLIKDMKYNVYCQNVSFTSYKAVGVKVMVSGSLGSFKGKPKKVFTKMAKASKRKSGLLDALLLMEEVALSKQLNGLKSEVIHLRFNYTLSWTDIR